LELDCKSNTVPRKASRLCGAPSLANHSDRCKAHPAGDSHGRGPAPDLDSDAARSRLFEIKPAFPLRRLPSWASLLHLSIFLLPSCFLPFLVNSISFYSLYVYSPPSLLSSPFSSLRSLLPPIILRLSLCSPSQLNLLPAVFLTTNRQPTNQPSAVVYPLPFFSSP
jgi:hypothetical protein